MENSSSIPDPVSLKEVVARLGPDATAKTVRQEAARSGLGIINAHLLCKTRNEIWPNRKKRNGGKPNRFQATTIDGLPESETLVATCPECKTPNTSIRKIHHLKNNTTRRQRKCNHCGHLFVTIDGVDEFRVTKSDRPLHGIRRKMNVLATEKECSGCSRVLGMSCFLKRTNSDVLYRSRCRDCNSHAHYKHNLKKKLVKYGLTEDAYFSILQNQDGVCAICRQPGTGKGRGWQLLCFDHCHKSGKFRSLLCTRCNLGIGTFGDDVSLLEKAINYIKQHSEGE